MRLQKIYKRALARLDGDDSPLNFGLGHIVWSDENFDFAEWCIEHFDEYKGDFSDAELMVVRQALRQALEELAKLPENNRCVEPDNYDGEHPELFPPPNDIEMIKI